MCATCDGFKEEIKMKSTKEYHKLLSQIREILDQKNMILVKGSCSLKEIQQNKPWPADVLEHIFKCTKCGQLFELCVETYHGSGGSWRVRV